MADYDEPEDTSPIMLHDLTVLNKVKDSGAIVLCKADIQVGGIVIRDVVLLLGTSGLHLSAPWAGGRPREDRWSVQFRCHRLRERLIAMMRAKYRELADVDMTRPKNRQGVAA